jgi:HlyD family secretion protein
MNILSKTYGWKLPIIAVFAIGFAITFVMSKPKPAIKDVVTAPPMSKYIQSVAGIGIIEPKSELINIGVEIPGIVRNIAIKVGDTVEKGAVLFELDQRDINAQIKTLEAKLISLKVQAEDAAAQFEIVNSMKDSRAVAKDDFNRRNFASQTAIAKVKEIESQIDYLTTTKERLTITAPIEGTILEVNIRPGEYASIGKLNDALVTMGDISTLHVRVEIDEENSNRLKSGSSAMGMIRGKSKEDIPLTFVRFEPYVKPKKNLAVSGQRVDTRVLQIIYALPNNTKDIFVGQQMDVFIKEVN